MSNMLAENKSKRRKLIMQYLESNSIRERLADFRDAIGSLRSNTTVQVSLDRAGTALIELQMITAIKTWNDVIGIRSVVDKIHNAVVEPSALLEEHSCAGANTGTAKVAEILRALPRMENPEQDYGELVRFMTQKGLFTQTCQVRYFQDPVIET
jgi:hypothetical protein